jgi:uncharacterized protein YjaG (DUF416 family)
VIPQQYSKPISHFNTIPAVADSLLLVLDVRLARLSPVHLAGFAASCSERLLPNYTAFSREEGWGDADTLRKALDQVWKCLEEHSLRNVDWDELIEECDPLLPDTEDFENPHVSAALDAGTAILSTLRCCKDGNPQHAVEAATYARDTVYMAVNSDTAETHPLMVRELEKQESDLELLESHPELSTAIVMQLRYTSPPNGRSNINLS